MDLSPIYAIGPMSVEKKTRETRGVAMKADSDSTRSVTFQNDPRLSHIRKRRCVECGAFLSRYNPEDYCFVHDLPPFQRFTW